MQKLNLNTTFVNTSGVPRFYAYVSPTGRMLQPGEEFTTFGDLFSIIASLGPGDKQIYLDGLQSDLDNGFVEIKNTPDGVFYDEELDASKVIRVRDGKEQVITADTD